MKCAECRGLIASGLPQDHTRAERAAVARHLDGCKPCLRWLKAGRKPVSAEQCAINRALILADLAADDPEA